jgi:hypothetical protein
MTNAPFRDVVRSTPVKQGWPSNKKTVCHSWPVAGGASRPVKGARWTFGSDACLMRSHDGNMSGIGRRARRVARDGDSNPIGGHRENDSGSWSVTSRATNRRVRAACRGRVPPPSSTCELVWWVRRAYPSRFGRRTELYDVRVVHSINSSTAWHDHMATLVTESGEEGNKQKWFTCRSAINTNQTICAVQW